MIKIYRGYETLREMNVFQSEGKVYSDLLIGTKVELCIDSVLLKYYDSELEYKFAPKLKGFHRELIREGFDDYRFCYEKPELKKAVLNNPLSMFETESGFLLGVRDLGDWEFRSFFQHNNGAIYEKSPDILGKLVSNEFIYGIENYNEFKKFDSQFKEIWNFPISYFPEDYSSLPEPIIYKQTVICFLGAEERNNLYIFGGLLVSLDDNTGELIWQKEFVNALDTTCIYEGILYVGTFEGVYLLNPKTGETLNFISSGHSEQIKTCRGRGYAEIVGNFIYYTHEASFTLTIFDKTSLEQVKQYQLPDSIRPSKHLFTHPETGVMYFYGFQDKIDIGGSYLLELNPAESRTQVCFEEKPTISHEFVPTKADANECELVITIDTPSLDDAIRYGEIVSRDLAMQHGDTVAQPQAWEIRYNRYPDKRFNGTIKVIFKGCIAESELINERLAVFEKRFLNWMGEINQITGWKNGKSNRQLVNLIAVTADKANELIAKKPITTPQNEQAHAYSQYTLADLLDAVIGQAPPDDSDFYSQLKHVAEKTINESKETEFKAIASAYLLMAVYYQNENDVTEKQAAFAKAAEYGSVNGAIELLSEVYFDSLALTTQATIIAMNKQDNEMWSCQEDVDYIFEKMPQQQRDEINKVAQAILNKWQAAKFESFYLY